MAFDHNRGVTVLFGGDVANSDTYEFDGVVWTRRSTTGPSPRRYASMVFDPRRGVCVLVGGGNSNGQSVGGTWEWDGLRWTEISVGGPGPWQGHSLAYFEARDQVIQFGGYSTLSTITNQTWALTSLTPVFTGSYDPSLGSLPQLQNWTLEEVGVNPNASVVNGKLLQGLTSFDGYQYWNRSDQILDFANEAFVVEIRLKVISSTYRDRGFDYRSGWQATFTDRNGRFVVLGITDTGLRVSNNASFSPSASSPFIPFDTSNLNSYLLTISQSGVVVDVNGSQVAQIAPPPPASGFGNNIWLFGDTTILGQSETQLQFIRWGSLGVPFTSAGPNDNAVANSPRPNPGMGSSTTFTYRSLTVNANGPFYLGSGETLNLNNGQGTLYINPGAVVYANGTIIGNIYNAGLLIIPITRAEQVFRTRGPGVVQLVVPPNTSPNQPPLTLPVPQQQPPRIDTGGYVSIGGSGFGGTNGGTPGGGGPGGGGGDARYPGNYILPTPSFESAGTAAWDGQLDVTGTYTQTDTGVLRMFIAGTRRGQSYSFLNVGQSASIDGEVQVVLQPDLFNFLPEAGTSFDLVTAAGGLTIASNGIRVRTLMTAEGAELLGLSLPPFESGFAQDPNALVVWPSDVFTYEVVNGTTLRVTLAQPLCSVLASPLSQQICPQQSATLTAFSSVGPPVTFVWQLQDDSVAGGWRAISDGLLVVDGLPRGTITGTDGTNPIFTPSDRVASRILLRTVAAGGCGVQASPPVTIVVCPADFNCDFVADFFDYLEFVGAWSLEDPSADFNADGSVDFFDYLDFVQAFDAGC